MTLTSHAPKSIHNGNLQYRYSIWYDIANGEDDQDYRLNIVVTHLHKPITITERYIKTDKIIDNSVVIYIEEIGDYYYYFILQGNMQVPEETSIEYFKTMIQSVVATKYKVET